MEQPVLTDKMLAFLEIRNEHGTDGGAAQAVNVVPLTITGWKRKGKLHRAGKEQHPRENFFLDRYEEVKQSMEPILEDFDEDTFLRKTVAPKALFRYNEILDQRITKDMTASEKQVIRQAALDVLKGTGVLNPDVQLTNIAVMVERFAEEGITYEAEWSKD